MKPILGIHHITALAGDPQRNVDFYTDVLGMRMVKKTVNFDAPDVYHLYYADRTGTPGTLLTFFPFPDAARGVRGAGEISALDLAVPPSSLDFWIKRLASRGVSFDGPQQTDGEPVIGLLDPDGMKISLVFSDRLTISEGWDGGSVPLSASPRGFLGASMIVHALEPSARMLTDLLGFRLDQRNGRSARFSVGPAGSAVTLTVHEQPDAPFARSSAGSVHHIAWRLADDETQSAWRQYLATHGVRVTEIVDRQYFHSIYFREPGGVLYEMATDNPGMNVDESIDELGSSLRLPPWYEPDRNRIERGLIPIAVRGRETAGRPEHNR